MSNYSQSPWNSPNTLQIRNNLQLQILITTKIDHKETLTNTEKSKGGSHPLWNHVEIHMKEKDQMEPPTNPKG